LSFLYEKGDYEVNPGKREKGDKMVGKEHTVGVRLSSMERKRIEQ
jgi:hypothetical protein